MVWVNALFCFIVEESTMNIENIDRSIVNRTQILVDRFHSVAGLSRFKLQQIFALLSVAFTWWGVFAGPHFMNEGVIIGYLFTGIMAFAILQVREEEHDFAEDKSALKNPFQESFIRYFFVVFLVVVGAMFAFQLDDIRRPLVYVCAYLVAFVYVSACEPRSLPKTAENQ